MVSIQNASKNFTSFPSGYAVDVAPGWLLFGSKISYDDLKGSKLKHTIWQNLVISAAYNNDEDSSGNNTNLGLGFKISFARGKLNKKLDTLVETITRKLAVIETKKDSLMNAIIEMDPEILYYDSVRKHYLRRGMPDSAAIVKAIQDVRVKELFENALALLNADYSELKAVVKTMNYDRYGFTLDLSAGTALLFPKQVFSDGYMNKTGVWLTGGYTTQGGFSFLALARYLYNPDKVFADDKGILKQDNLSTLDGGARLLYSNSKSKFTFSGEGVYRSVLQKTDINPTWRFTINADYEVAPSKILSLSLGRDYDGTFNKDGNVIAAINLVIGFGNMVKTAK